MREIYWQAAHNLVDWWESYTDVKRLHDDMAHEVPSPNALRKMQSFYRGSFPMLMRHESGLDACVNSSLERFEMICAETEVEPVTRDWLDDYLKEARDCRVLRCRIEIRQLKKGEPVSLKYLV